MRTLRFRLSPLDRNPADGLDLVEASSQLRSALTLHGAEYVRMIRTDPDLEAIVFFRSADPLKSEPELCAAISRHVATSPSLSAFEVADCALDFFLSVEIAQPPNDLPE